MQREWAVEISGTVTTLTNDLARVGVPRGAYQMREAARQVYELSRFGGPTFLCSKAELSGYVAEKVLRILSGPKE